MNTHTGSSSTSTRSSSSSGAASSSSHRTRHPVAGIVSGEQWLPAVLAPSMPAAYSNVLEQLGCSREVGLWLAMLKTSGQQQQLCGLSGVGVFDWVASGVTLYGVLVQGLNYCSVYHPQLAVQQLLLGAASYQWLSCMPPSSLLACQAAVGMCRAAAHAYSYGLLADWRRLAQ
jgi:hypothetical protein